MSQPLQQVPPAVLPARASSPVELLKRLANPRIFALMEAVTAAATNFAISVVIARSYSAATFSGYLTALSAAFVAMAFVRVSFSMACAVKPESWYARKLPALAAIHGLAIAASITIISLLMISLAIAMGGELWVAAAVFAPGVIFWFLGYEFERGLLIRRSLHKRLVLIGLVQAAAMALVLLLVHEFAAPYMLLAAAMALIGCARTSVTVLAVTTPDWKKGARQFAAGMRRLGPSATAYLLGSVSCSHAPVFSLSFLATPEQAAAFGAMRTLFQPVQVFFRSRDVVVQAHFHSDRAADQRSLARQYWAGLLRTAVLSALLSLVLLVSGPWLVHAVYGGRFDAHMTTFWLWAVIMLCINLASITDAYVSYAGRQGRYGSAQIAAGIATVVLSVTLVTRWGDVGAAIAAIAGWSIILLGGALLLGRTPRQKGV